MKKVCILTQSHLCRNPRVVKEANALAEAGFDVTILTTFTFAELLQEDQTLIDTSKIKYKGIVNMIPGQSARWYILTQRIIKRIASELINYLKIELPHALNYHYSKNYRMAKKTKADLFICHQEASTVIGYRLLKAGRNVAFDFEDWYSHDLLPEANKYRPLKLLMKVEKYILNHSKLVYTTSKSLAKAYADFADAKEPKVLHNVFPISEREAFDGQYKDRMNHEIPSIHWYSQTIGPGRGLEMVVEALEAIDKKVQLHLRGRCDEEYQEKLKSTFPFHKGHQLHFHDLVPHKELLARIHEHDIGLATEQTSPDSRNLTITNKILQYLLAGIAVIATNTSGQIELAKETGAAIKIFDNQKPQSFAVALSELISHDEALQKAKQEAEMAGLQKFNWDVEKKELIHWIKTVTQ